MRAINCSGASIAPETPGANDPQIRRARMTGSTMLAFCVALFQLILKARLRIVEAAIGKSTVSLSVRIMEAESTLTAAPKAISIVAGIVIIDATLANALIKSAKATSPLRIRLQKAVTMADGEQKARSKPAKIVGSKKNRAGKARIGTNTNIINNETEISLGLLVERIRSVVSILRLEKNIRSASRMLIPFFQIKPTCGRVKPKTMLASTTTTIKFRLSR